VNPPVQESQGGVQELPGASHADPTATLRALALNWVVNEEAQAWSIASALYFLKGAALS